MPSHIQVGERRIGAGEPCFIIAEAGVNHNGEIELAHRLIDIAADARVDAVKFQTFDPELLASPDAEKAQYQVENMGESGSQLEMLRKLVLPPEVYPALLAHAHHRGLMFLSTPFDESSADFLYQLALPAIKVSSGDLDNIPFLEHLAARGVPILLSTGMATLAEVGQAVNTIRRTPTPLALFHCMTNYPAAPADCNLRAMETLSRVFDVPVGWSDHTEGTAVSIAAAALGAVMLEKHFTLDRNLPGPDHRASLEPGELKAMVEGIRQAEAALGDGQKRPRPSEIAIAPIARKSLHWRQKLPEGSVIARESVIALRPAVGLPTVRLASIVGRRVRRAVVAGQPISDDDLES